MKIRATVVGEIEIPDDIIEEAYGTTDHKKIIEIETINWQEWILDNVVSEKIEII